jgi:hypothetical protein
MPQALSSPVYRSIAVVGLLLALTLAFGHPAGKHHGRRLVLHAVAEPNSIYLSAWSNGDVVLTDYPDTPATLVFSTRASVSDGCRWLGTETLEPLGRSYSYRYDETILDCDADAVPFRKTPRTGIVTVEN